MDAKPILFAAALSATATSFITSHSTPPPAANAPITVASSSGSSMQSFANTSSTSSTSSTSTGSLDGAFMLMPGPHVDEVEARLRLTIDPDCHEILFADRSRGRHGRAGGDDWCLEQVRSALARQFPELVGPMHFEPERGKQPRAVASSTGTCKPGAPRTTVSTPSTPQQPVETRPDSRSKVETSR